MHSFIRLYKKALQGLFCSLMFVSCQPYEPYTREEVFKGAYARNFVRTFGAIDPSMDWDFTDKIPVEDKTRSYEDELAEITDQDGRYVVSATLYTQITNQIRSTEITDKSFAFLIDENACFEIFPVYLTSSYYGKINWSLQMLVDNINVLNSSDPNYPGWKIGTNVEVRTKEGGAWEKFQSNSVCREYGMRSPYIAKYTNSGEKKLMHLALHISPDNIENELYAITNSQQSSLHYQMRILNIHKPKGIGDNLQTLFVACEAADVEGNSPTEKRYRSLVLMIVGTHIPQVLYVRTDNQGKEWIDYEGSGKRYMIEDLGSASDFDFNDVVLDVVQASSAPVLVTQVSKRGTGAKLTSARIGPPQVQETRASIRFLCGTRPFKLTVGEYSFGLVTNPTDEEQTKKQLLKDATEGEATYFNGPMEVMGWEPNVHSVIPNWDPSNNQVSIEVWNNDTKDFTKGGWTAQFPLKGEVPFIMALPTNTPWNPEGVPFTVWQKYIPRK